MTTSCMLNNGSKPRKQNVLFHPKTNPLEHHYTEGIHDSSELVPSPPGLYPSTHITHTHHTYTRTHSTCPSTHITHTHHTHTRTHSTCHMQAQSHITRPHPLLKEAIDNGFVHGTCFIHPLHVGQYLLTSKSGHWERNNTI